MSAYLFFLLVSREIPTLELPDIIEAMVKSPMTGSPSGGVKPSLMANRNLILISDGKLEPYFDKGLLKSMKTFIIPSNFHSFIPSKDTRDI